MKRFMLSREAARDLAEVLEYLSTLPSPPSIKIGRAILQTLQSIAEYPHFGTPQSGLSLLAGTAVHTRLTSSYRIFYRVDKRYPEIIGIVHTARDLPSVMEKRLQ